MKYGKAALYIINGLIMFNLIDFLNRLVNVLIGLAGGQMHVMLSQFMEILQDCCIPVYIALALFLGRLHLQKHLTLTESRITRGREVQGYLQLHVGPEVNVG